MHGVYLRVQAIHVQELDQSKYLHAGTNSRRCTRHADHGGSTNPVNISEQRAVLAAPLTYVQLNNNYIQTSKHLCCFRLQKRPIHMHHVDM
jgi:hypothetical protein